MDSIDQEILTILMQNSQLTNKKIGEKIHMTGQAVGNRILKLQEKGLIHHFSIKINYPYTQFVRIFMDTPQFNQFEQLANSYKEVEAIYKVSGQACYMLICHFSQTSLSEFIEAISKWGRYSVETVVADKTRTQES